MSFLSKALKSGIAVKALSEARKPENQRRVRSAFESLQAKAAQRRRPEPPAAPPTR